jgi:hypothetical protein
MAFDDLSNYRVCVRVCVFQAFAIVDREILTSDAKRASEIENYRKALHDARSSPARPLNKFGLVELDIPANSFGQKGHLTGLAKGLKGSNAQEPKPATFSGRKP